jgi:4-amino-4-deoxy-L-arabinose transferase-like glycosyltransferase
MSTTHDMPLDARSTRSSHALPTAPTRSPWPLAHVLLLLGLWLIIFVSATFTPPLLDDADSTHAQASQAMLSTGDWVTLHVDGIRYLEKPPLPYWITAVSLKLFAPSSFTRTQDRGSLERAGLQSHHKSGSYPGALAPEDAAAFAVHFPLALTILGLTLLGYAWARRAFPSADQHTALYTGIFLLTSAGVFLFTRVFIPDALLSLLLAFTLYALLRVLEPPLTKLSPSAQDPGAPGLASETGVRRTPDEPLPQNPGAPSVRASADGWDNNAPAAPTNQQSVILSEARSAQPKDPDTLSIATTGGRFPTTSPALSAWPYAMWTSLALAVLTKGLVAIVFILATALLFLFWTHQLHLWRRLRPFTGILVFLAIAAPWHILAGLRNTGGLNGHGFFWFYFINEHVLRFLGRRIPRDYNKLPGYLYWSLHLVWLFPWSLFAPAALITAWRKRKSLLSRPGDNQVPQGFSLGHQTILLLIIFSTLVLAFFSLSTNQEYYTFPIYLPLLMLLAASLTSIERNVHTASTPGAPHLASEMWVSTKPNQSPEPLDPTLRRALTFTFATYTTLGLAIAAALAYGLWSSRHLPFVPDIGELLAHRNVGDYTLSMSHFFDLTGPSFAALRLPATLALMAFLIGPPIAWFLHARRRSLQAILTIALTSTAFLVAAHIAFVRFNPMLSSVNFARTIQTLEHTGQISPDTIVLIFGDQAFGSSIPFYLDRRVDLVDGRTTSMLFGSTFPDAPPIFLTSADLLAQWGHGPRKLLFVPLERRDDVDQLLGNRQIILQQTSGKALITDRPLNQPSQP